MTTPNLKPLVKLARELLKKSQRGELQWAQTDVDTVFGIHLPRGSVTIETVATQPRIAVFDDRGIEVDAYTSRPFMSHRTTEDEAELNDLLGELHELARRAALNTDTVIGNILEDL